MLISSQREASSHSDGSHYGVTKETGCRGIEQISHCAFV